MNIISVLFPIWLKSSKCWQHCFLVILASWQKEKGTAHISWCKRATFALAFVTTLFRDQRNPKKGVLKLGLSQNYAHFHCSFTFVQFKWKILLNEINQKMNSDSFANIYAVLKPYHHIETFLKCLNRIVDIELLWCKKNPKWKILRVKINTDEKLKLWPHYKFMESVKNPNLDPEIVFSSRQIADKKWILARKLNTNRFVPPSSVNWGKVFDATAKVQTPVSGKCSDYH